MILGGGRNWEQVLANAFTGTAISLLYLYTVGHTEFAFDVINHPWASSILAAYIGYILFIKDNQILDK